MSQITQAKHHRTVPLFWMGMLVLAFVVSVGFLTRFALPYLLLDTEVLGRFDGRWGWILTHIAAGSVALFVGPFQLWMGATGKAKALHRRLGMTYLISIAVSCFCAFYLAATTLVSWVFGAGLGGLACAWVITTGLAYIAVRRRLYLQHQEWMIRSYVVTLGFVFFRIFVGATSAFDVGTLIERLNGASWFCWAFPLLVAEAIIQGRKMAQSEGAG